MILQGDNREVLRTLPSQSVRCCVTSPPYWGLRDYGVDGQLGLEQTPEEYVQNMVEVFREVRRVLRDDGTLWLNLGDSYASNGGRAQPHRDSSGGIGKKGTRGEQGYHASGGGFDKPDATKSVYALKTKDLVGIPWMIAFALRADGWYLRSDIIWSKPNAMPESVTDRPTKAHEYIFLLSKSETYYYDHEAAKEKAVSNHSSGNGFKRNHRLSYAGRGNDEQWKPTEKRNRRTVWSVNTKPYKEAHFATYPPELIEPCILSGSEPGDMVLDPFNGAGTTGLVSLQNNRQYIGIELNPEYIEITNRRLAAIQPVMNF